MSGKRGHARSDSFSPFQSGNRTPRGEASSTTPRGARTGMFGARRAAGHGGAFGTNPVLNLADIQAELDHAELNAHHNRRIGNMYNNYKRPARRNDADYPDKRMR